MDWIDVAKSEDKKMRIISKTTGMALWLGLLLAGLMGCDSNDHLTGNEMYITPASHTFKSADDKVVTLSVQGAKPPMRWSVSDPNMGSITGVPSGSNATHIVAANYERRDDVAGINTVIVTDARGWKASSVMNVPQRVIAPEPDPENE